MTKLIYNLGLMEPTQARRLADALRREGIPARTDRRPGGKMTVLVHNKNGQAAYEAKRALDSMPDTAIVAPGAKFKIGDHICSWQSGKTYVVKEIVLLDLVGTYAYRVRQLRGGQEWGPHRLFGDSSIGGMSEPVKV